MTEIYLHFIFTHYGLYGNRPYSEGRDEPVWKVHHQVARKSGAPTTGAVLGEKHTSFFGACRASSPCWLTTAIGSKRLASGATCAPIIQLTLGRRRRGGVPWENAHRQRALHAVRLAVRGGEAPAAPAAQGVVQLAAAEAAREIALGPVGMDHHRRLPHPRHSGGRHGAFEPLPHHCPLPRLPRPWPQGSSKTEG